MLLKKLFLKNIRTFEEETILFPKGVVLLEGDIGSGKTTILKSIEFALFGAGPHMRAGSLLRKGKTSACVNLKLEIEGKNISIKRGLKKTNTGEITQTKSELIIDDLSYLCSPKEIRSKIINLLNYPSDMVTKNPSLLFRYTVYNPQEETKQILRMKKEDRSELFGKIFSTEQYKQIRENASVFKKNMREEGEYLRGIFNNLEDNQKHHEKQKHELSELKNKKNATEKKMNELTKEANEINKNYEHLNKEEEKLEKIKKKFEIQTSLHNEKTNYLTELKKREEDEKLSIEKIQIQLKSFNALFNKEFDKKEIDELKIRKENLQNKIEEHYEIKKKLQIKLAQIQQNAQNKEKTITKKNEINERENHIQKKIEELKQCPKEESSFQKQMTEMETNLQKDRALSSSKNTRISIMEKEINEITSLSMCPLCKQNVSHTHKSSILDKNQKEIDKLSNELNDINTSIKSIEEKIVFLKNKLNEMTNKKEELKYLEKSFVELKIQEEQITEEQKQLALLRLEEQKIILELEKINKFDEQQTKNQIKDIDQKTIELEKYKKDFQRRNDLLQYEKEKKQTIDNLKELKIRTAKSITELTKSIELEKKQIYEYADLEVKIKKTKQNKDEINALLENQKIEFARDTTRMNTLQEQEKELSEAITKMNETKKKHRKINQIVNWTDNLFIPLIKNIETNVLARIHSEFEERFSKWFSLLINSDFFSTYIDEEFTPIIEQSGFDIDFDNLSGGEQTAVALCYRLALNQVINNLTGDIKTRDLIILDEPTDGFSEEQLEQLGVVIGNLKLSQIIIVSHEQKMRGFADNIIYLKKTDNRSFVV